MPKRAPLITVNIRSMNRPMLHDALDSIAAQTYANVEVVVVNATGENHSELGVVCGRFPLRLVHQARALTRSDAANFGMERARGQYLIFLDDDDFFLPNHLEKLSLALAQGSARASYTGVKLVGDAGQTRGVLDEPWNVDRLRGANFLPIHAVLFERSLLDSGCRFREDLDCLEDWDFWLQIAALTPFEHVPQVSAVYRIDLGTSGLSAVADAEKHITNRARIFETWQPRFTSREWVRSIHWFENARNHFYQLALDRFHENQQLEIRLVASSESLVDLRSQLKVAEAQAQSMRAKVNRLNHQRGIAIDLAANHASHAKALLETVQQLIGSTSWRITGPLRFVVRIARGEHAQALHSVRRRLGALSKRMGLRLPMSWTDASVSTMGSTDGSHSAKATRFCLTPTSTTMSEMVDLGCVEALDGTPVGRTAVHAHIFYADIAAEFADYLNHIPFAFDLFVSVPSEEMRITCGALLSRLPMVGHLKTVVVPNRGRDMASMFCTFGENLRQYDYVAHIHSKKSLYNDGATLGWREYLLEQLLGSPLQIQKIFALLSGQTGIGLVYPQNYSKLPYWANTWLSNKPLGRAWCQRLGIDDIPNGYFDYPAGSMFWARKEVLKPLFDAGLTLQDFPTENGQQDATLAHCLERLFALTANQSGYKTAILRDPVTPRSSAWGLEQYLGQTGEGVRAVIAGKDIQVVVFDIFDTLLLRPLLSPETTKKIVAQNAGTDNGKAYLRFRSWIQPVDATSWLNRSAGVS